MFSSTENKEKNSLQNMLSILSIQKRVNFYTKLENIKLLDKCKICVLLKKCSYITTNIYTQQNQHTRNEMRERMGKEKERFTIVED